MAVIKIKFTSKIKPELELKSLYKTYNNKILYIKLINKLHYYYISLPLVKKKDQLLLLAWVTWDRWSRYSDIYHLFTCTHLKKKNHYLII